MLVHEPTDWHVGESPCYASGGCPHSPTFERYFNELHFNCVDQRVSWSQKLEQNLKRVQKRGVMRILT